MKVEVGKDYNNAAEIFMILLMYMYFILKPLYLLQSGGMQAADYVLVGAFMCFIIYRIQTKNYKIDKGNKVYLLFTACTCVINGIYFLIYKHISFIISSSWYVFIGMFLLVISECYMRQDVLKRIYNIININIYIQFVIWLFKLGRVYLGVRYMGSFNDPNQYGFFMLTSIFFIYILEKILKLKHNYISYVIAIFLLYLSLSTGSFLGIVTFLGLLVCINIKNIKSIINISFIKKFINKIKNNKKPIIISSLLLLFFTVMSFLFINEVYGGIRNLLVKDEFVKRIVYKIENVENTIKQTINKAMNSTEQTWKQETPEKVVNQEIQKQETDQVVNQEIQKQESEQLMNQDQKVESKNKIVRSPNILEERGYDKILLYPEKILYGAGQGLDKRFKTYHDGEFHATFPSILFYYGIIPFLIICYWIYINIKKVDFSRMIIYISVFLESFVLLNQRQPLFWFLILLGNLEELVESKKLG